MKRLFAVIAILFLVGCCGGQEHPDYSTALYLQFDADEFVDSSIYNHTVTPVDDVSIDNETVWQRTGSGLFSGGYLSIPDAPILNFLNSNFKIDLYFRPNSLGMHVHNVISQHEDSDNYWSFTLVDTGAIAIENPIHVYTASFVIVSGGIVVADYSFPEVWIFSDILYNHVVLKRSGNTIDLYIENIQSIKIETVAITAAPDFNADIIIGNGLNGWMDEVRIIRQ